MISEKIFASIATIPFSRMVPSTMVSIPSSISLAVNLILFVDASIKIHSRIGMVVFPGIAFRTIFTLFKRLLFEHTNFIVLITPLWVK